MEGALKIRPISFILIPWNESGLKVPLAFLNLAAFLALCKNWSAPNQHTRQ
jgi:hypothetical protein